MKVTMKNTMKNNHSIGIAFSICLLCVFTVLSALLIYMGNNVYREILSNEKNNNSQRNTLTYLVSKARTADSVEGIEIRQFNGKTLVAISDGSCETLIYHYKDGIYEAYIDKKDSFSEELGERIAYADGFEAIKNGKLLELQVQIDNKVYRINCGLH